MHQFFKLNLLRVAMCALAICPVAAFAQGISGGSPAPIEESVFVTVPGTVSCFDYYRFGSVETHIAAEVASVVSGVPIAFSGTIENTNPYPIVDGTLYVKIFRARAGGFDANGHDVVDQFVALSDVTIPARGRVPVSFSWQVPSAMRSGEYQVATFFMTSRKFNLMGLSFTDDVVGGTARFTVSGEETSGLQFDKASITVAGEDYQFASFPPRVSTSEPIEVRAIVRNTTSAPQRANVTWAVYQWDAQLRENAVQEEAQTVDVPAQGSAPVTIKIVNAQYPVYLAVGTVSWKDTKSIVGVRFVREGQNRTRINFPGVLSYPLRSGEENTIFSCLHNSGDGHIVGGGRLELTLSDMQGNLIHEYIYEGDVTGAMMGIAEKFVPRRDYDRFVLDARLYHDGQFVDEAHLEYDCARISPDTCGPDSSEGKKGAVLWGLLEQEGFVRTVLIVVPILAIVAVLLLARMARSRRVVDTITTNNTMS